MLVPVGLTSSSRKRRGVVLLGVLVVVVILTLTAYQYSELMLAERRTADSYARTMAARAAADSAIAYVEALMSDPEAFATGGNPYDNPSKFQDIPVGQGAVRQTYFSIVAPLDPEEAETVTQPFRYGVMDEGSKIDLNGLMKLDPSGEVAYNILLKLPNMTEEIANSIILWMDPRNQPRTGAADNTYYTAQPQPYRLKNAPLDSVEELLLVQGVTPQLLFGNDRNRNGKLDPEESGDGEGLNLGWSAYFTVYNSERNVDQQGNPRIYINGNSLSELAGQLSQAGIPNEVIQYIQAYRLYGPATSTGSSGSAPSGSGVGGNLRLAQNQMQTDSRRRPSRRIASLFELIDTSVNVQVQVTIGRQQVMTTVSWPSPLNDPSKVEQYLPIMLDKLTTTRNSELPARVNINTAPRTVLLALPELTEADVQTILDTRPSLSSQEAADEIFQTPAWLITEANFSAAKVRTLDRYVTTRSQVYRVQALGYFAGAGPTARVEAVIHTNGGRPRILYWRDLTELGKGYDLKSP